MVSRSIGVALMTMSELLTGSATTRTRFGFTPEGAVGAPPPPKQPPPVRRRPGAPADAAAAVWPVCCCCGPLKISEIVLAASAATTFLSLMVLNRFSIAGVPTEYSPRKLHDAVERLGVLALEDQLVPDHPDDDGFLLGLGVHDLGGDVLVVPARQRFANAGGIESGAAGSPARSSSPARPRAG